MYAACSDNVVFWFLALRTVVDLSRRSSIQGDDVSCIRDYLKSLLSELRGMIPEGHGDHNGVYICG